MSERHANSSAARHLIRQIFARALTYMPNGLDEPNVGALGVARKGWMTLPGFSTNPYVHVPATVGPRENIEKVRRRAFLSRGERLGSVANCALRQMFRQSPRE